MSQPQTAPTAADDIDPWQIFFRDPNDPSHLYIVYWFPAAIWSLVSGILFISVYLCLRSKRKQLMKTFVTEVNYKPLDFEDYYNGGAPEWTLKHLVKPHCEQNRKETNSCEEAIKKKRKLRLPQWTINKGEEGKELLERPDSTNQTPTKTPSKASTGSSELVGERKRESKSAEAKKSGEKKGTPVVRSQRPVETAAENNDDAFKAAAAEAEKPPLRPDGEGKESKPTEQEKPASEKEKNDCAANELEKKSKEGSKSKEKDASSRHSNPAALSA